MDGAISFTVCSLFFSVLLTLVYFSKKRLSTLENKLYAVLIINQLNRNNYSYFMWCCYTYDKWRYTKYYFQ